MHHEVVIVGGGPSGIGAAIRLREAGVTDLLIVEKADSFGGTWRANTYPGCACDVPSALYSFSFAPNPEWTRAFARQPEILTYLRDVAARHDLEQVTRFGTEMTDSRWDGERWHIDTTTGPLTARFLVAAAGPWNEPLLPELPGLDTFPGPVFHSSRWDHDADLAGRRVAVVGSGASAVQIVPEIVPEVARLELFQRTAQWVLPKPDHYVPRVERWLMRTVPGAQRALRRAEYAGDGDARRRLPSSAPHAPARVRRTGTSARDGERPRPAAPAHPVVHVGVQAAAVLQHLLPGARAAPRRRARDGSRGGPRQHADRCRRHAGRGRRDRARHRLQDPRHARRSARP